LTPARRHSEPAAVTARTFAVLVIAVALVLAATSTALAAPPTDRSMHLECGESDLVIMRSNGSNWWGGGADGQPDGTVYVTTRLDVTLGGESVHSQSYGIKTGLGPSTTWTAETSLGFSLDRRAGPS
jgi:hypothetical protein